MFKCIEAWIQGKPLLDIVETLNKLNNKVPVSFLEYILKAKTYAFPVIGVNHIFYGETGNNPHKYYFLLKSLYFDRSLLPTDPYRQTPINRPLISVHPTIG